MLPTISPPELTLLAYLQAHSGGSGERISLDPKPIARSLRISVTQLAENSASLAAHGFAGVRNFRPDARDVPSSSRSAIWVTKKGEEYLKQALGPAGRSTVQQQTGESDHLRGTDAEVDDDANTESS